MKKILLLCLIASTNFYSLNSQAEADVTKAVIDKAIEGGFTELEKQIIDKYFKESGTESGDVKSTGKKKKKNKELPPGLAKKEKLPPGLAKQLERNGTLPPGLAKRNLPDDLEAKLPKPAEGLERTIVNNAVVLVEKATGRIVDIMKDVVTEN